MAKKKKEEKEREIVVSAPDMRVAVFHIRGTQPYVQNKFSNKAIDTIREQQLKGHSSKKGKAKSPKNFNEMYESSKHVSTEKWYGIPAIAFRKAMISACRLAGFKMTIAKLSVFIIPDGFDDRGKPLVKITKGRPVKDEDIVKIQRTIDLHARALWKPGWEAKVTIRWDNDQFTIEDLTNLLIRVGIQVGIGEGRPDSPNSAGLGFGLFDILNKEQINETKK